jgi:hypothetical protein
MGSFTYSKDHDDRRKKNRDVYRLMEQCPVNCLSRIKSRLMGVKNQKAQIVSPSDSGGTKTTREFFFSFTQNVSNLQTNKIHIIKSCLLCLGCLLFANIF